MFVRRAGAATAIILALLPAPASAQGSGSLGPEVRVAEPVPTPAGADQQDAQIAAGDGGFLAVWEDARECCTPTIYGARLDHDAEPVDRVGIRIAPADSWGQEPGVARAGTHYVVVWESGPEIRVARVSPDGSVLDSPPVATGLENGAAFAPDVASTGGAALVVWAGCVYEAGDCETDLYGALLDPDGGVRGPFVLVDDPGDTGFPSIAADADGYLLTWAIEGGPDRGIHAVRVHADGTLAGAPVLAAPGPYDGVDVAYGGDHFMAVWYSLARDDLNVLGMRLTPDAAPLDQEPVVLAFGDAVQWNPKVAADGRGGYYAVWEDRQRGRDVYGTRVTYSGQPLRVNGTLVSTMRGNSTEPAVASDGSATVVVWTSERAHSRDVYGVGRRVADPPPEDPRPVALDLNRQALPALAWNGRVFLAVWADGREGPGFGDVYAARVTPSGRVLDGTGFKVSSQGETYWPVVASDGRDFLVAWVDYRAYRRRDRRTDVYGARVLADGTVTGEIAISTARDYQQGVDLAWTGTSYLAVWEDLRSGVTGDFTGHADLYATPITRSGRVVSPRGRPLAVGRRNHGTPDVVAGGGHAFVAWTAGCHAWRSHECNRDVFATRVSPRGRPVGDRLDVASTAASESYPAAMIGPRGYYVVWRRGGGAATTLVGRRLRPNGRLTRPRVLVSDDDDVFAPMLEWTGTSALLAWNVSPESHIGSPGDVFATWITATGRVEGKRTTVAGESGPELGTDVAAGPPGCAAVAYTRRPEDPEVGVRAFLRLTDGCA